MTKLTALFLASLTTAVLSSEPVPFTINTKKWNHILDDHFISITVNPTDLLQGKVYGLAMNSTMAMLKGLAPAYVRIGSADTAKYTFKRNRYPSDVVKPDDEFTVTETHWMVFNEVAKQAGLDVIVCLNAAHRSEGTKKWDTRNSLELISFSDSQGYNLTWQLGYEVQGGDDLSGLQFGKDLNRLRTILNAFPRYQQAKLIGPDIRVIHKKEEIDFWNDVLIEAGPTLDAVTWHPRWPQPSKMKVSDNSDLGYEFPNDYLEWDRAQLSKILQKSIFKNPVWIGETKRESIGTFAEGLIWARRLVLAAKLGIEVVMKQPNLMDVTHPKPEYWVALLHKRLLGKSVLETRSVANITDLTVISHCTNPFYWSDKPEKLHDGAVTVYGVNLGGMEQKIQIKGTWSGKSQLLFQYVLTSGSDPDSVFSQMTYLNGEPLMMTDDGLLPDIIPKIKKMERGLAMKLPPYSVGFWVIPEAKVKICQVQSQNMPTINIETLTPSSAVKSSPKTLENIRDINQFLLEKLKNPESESEEVPEVKIEVVSSESSEKDVSLPKKENNLPRVARRIRQVNGMDDINQELKTIMRETQQFLTTPDGVKNLNLKVKLPKTSQTMEQRIQGLAEGISDAIKHTNQEQEFNKFLEDAGLKQDFGSVLMSDGRFKATREKDFQPYFNSQNPEGLLDEFNVKERLKRSISISEDFSQEESIEDEEESLAQQPVKFSKKISLVLKEADEKKNQKQDLIIPHQPDFKGLEEKYKQIVQGKIKDGKRKIDDIKKKIKQNETEISQKIKPPEVVNDIQEEIIKKEIELLEKTEETVADILKSQKKRQETFEDIIFDELNDVKGERIRELNEMQKTQRKQENSIVKRQAQTPLSKPLLKTVEYIEKNFNLEPESVRKIKRSLEERMGEILRNYDTKKSLEIKKQRVPTLKEERKVIFRKSVKENDQNNEQSNVDLKIEKQDDTDRAGTFTKDRPKEKNVIKKSSSSQVHRATKKSVEESTQRTKKIEKDKNKYSGDENDSFEMFNERKLQEPVKKTSRRRPAGTIEERKTLKKPKSTQKEKDSGEHETKKEHIPIKEGTVKSHETIEEELKSEPIVERAPLKNDKERREHMLQQITIMVDKMNSKEKGGDGYEDISEEFESDRRPRNIKRRPRKADLNEELPEKISEKTDEIPITEASVKPTPASKLSKLKKIRVRPNRKQKEVKRAENEKEEESLTKKRHLIERPFIEFDKKKGIKPKLRKLNSKFQWRGNELLPNENPEIPIEKQKVLKSASEPEASGSVVLHENEELKKDLEEIVEEKIFLGQGSEISKEKLETNGRELFETKVTEATPEETTTPTEGFIIVEPTEEIAFVETTTAKKTHVNLDGSTPEYKDKASYEKEKTEESENPTPEVESEDKIKEFVQTTTVEKQNDDTPKEDHSSKDILRNLDSSLEKKASVEIMDDTSNSSSHEDVESKLEELSEAILHSAGVDNAQRKRRATFLPKHEEEDEEDYSSEERIQKFKQMIYRKSPTKKPIKNEVRSTSSMGMGADEFLRMAGSTVRVMFDDVIPEAYGQTKNKIQNMGIPEYIKEFGKIVQQMKNLDQIFLNIGEAAVKGYIKGDRAEKGPYIQVISRKKREITENEKQEETEGTYEATSLESEMVLNEETDQIDPVISTTDMSLMKPPAIEGITEGSNGYATTSTGEESTVAGQRSHRENTRYTGTPRRKHGQSVHEDDKTRSLENTEGTKNVSFEKTEAEKAPENALGGQSEKSEDQITSTQETFSQSKSSHKKSQTRKKTDLHPTLSENELKKKMSVYVPEDLQEKIFSPWIKTTKDFIQQALTTLKRQRELSEILANDLMNGEMAKRAIGKREIGEEEPRLPVYYMISPKGNKKRETQEQSDENLRRHLRGLQPGVYVVPTEEMTNIRSEQITNEAKAKSGMPNVVTLNIYYDKKNADASAKANSGEQSSDPKVSQDAVTYYQNKAWNAAAGHYGQNNQYLTVPNPNLATPVVSSLSVNPALQTQTVFAGEPRMAELPSSRLIQYPSPTYHYPAVQKMYPSTVPNSQSVYGPVYYLPQENRYVQPPGTKRQWREFRARSGGVPVGSNLNSGWNIQYEIPTSVRNSAKSVVPTSYNKNYKFLIQDRKRSIGDFKTDPTWSETALPFWKFFSTSEKKNKNEEPKSAEKEETESAEINSSEDVFVENRKRAKAAVENKIKAESVEQVTEEKVPEEGQLEEEKSRKRRSTDYNSMPQKLTKRSSTYAVEFRDHDILPEWFGTYQEIDNGLVNFPPHTRRSHIISTPWSDEDEELLSILNADDELSLVDLDTDDYYYSNDNAIQHSKRYPRSTDQFESNLIRSNMIYKIPIDREHLKPKDLKMTGVKKLSDEDSSLELATKSKPVEIKTTGSIELEKQPEQEVPQRSTEAIVQQPTIQLPLNQTLPSQNATSLLPRNPHDDTFYYFFKYAYDSLVKVMKSMTELF